MNAEGPSVHVNLPDTVLTYLLFVFADFVQTFPFFRGGKRQVSPRQVTVSPSSLQQPPRDYSAPTALLTAGPVRRPQQTPSFKELELPPRGPRSPGSPSKVRSRPDSQ